MKKLYLLILTLTMLVGLIPQAVMAAEVTPVGLNLTDYLNQVSNTRGFEVTQEDVSKTLSANGMTIEDFNTVDEISTYLGDVIKADSSNLDRIYQKYYLDQTTLTQVLAEYGEELSDYIFINDLDMSLDFFTDDGIVIQEPDFDANLVAYLAEASSVRGFEVTIEAVDLYLSEYDMTTDDFATVEELSDYLGDIIKADLSNLDYFDTNYEINQEALLQLLQEEKKNIDKLVYMDQIESIIWSSDSSEVVTVDKANDDTIHTVKGGTLPTTAGDYILNVLIGMMVILIGILLYRKVKNVKGEIL